MTLAREWTPPSAGRHGRTWRTVRAQAFERDRAADARCWICGRPINYAGDPRTDPWAWQPDHYYPVRDFPELANDITNIRPSHARCNNERGQQEKAARKRARELGEPSEDWGI